MRKVAVLALLFGWGFLWIPAASATGFTFTTLPASGNITGLAGTTIGWGYTLTNNDAILWLNPVGLNANSFAHGLANALFDFPILAPGATVSVAYDGLNGLGLYELTWNANAPVGFVNTGGFDLTVEWWDGDPLGNGNPVQLDVHSISPYTATVYPPSIDPVPEPSTLFLMVAGLGALYWIKKKELFMHG